MLVDDKNYAQSWTEAAKAFQGRQKTDAWAADEAAKREPLGAVASRDLKSIDLGKTNIAVIRYDTVFAHKAAAVETVTLAFENGSWSVTGYSVTDSGGPTLAAIGSDKVQVEGSQFFTTGVERRTKGETNDHQENTACCHGACADTGADAWPWPSRTGCRRATIRAAITATRDHDGYYDRNGTYQRIRMPRPRRLWSAARPPARLPPGLWSAARAGARLPPRQSRHRHHPGRHRRRPDRRLRQPRQWPCHGRRRDRRRRPGQRHRRRHGLR